MLFNSQLFIFVFLPITGVFFFFLPSGNKGRWPLAWLVICSLVFYAHWNPAYIILLLASISFNYLFGFVLRENKALLFGGQNTILILGIAFNLGLLGYFKYVNFIVGNINFVMGTEFQEPSVLLPLAISFFTFQQIAYLVDVYRGEAGRGFLNYCLFVTFFPQLIAGPIVHHKEMIPQFEKRGACKFNGENLSVGLTIFFLGLFKKVILADGIGAYSTPIFNAAESQDTITFFVAWYAALGYTLQLYFDFSGYADMAIGLAKIFGIKLPLNFNSPYKSPNIIEFWRNWHMTLSRFMRDYLYIPLGGGRKGPKRQLINLMTAMLLGGLWHGAGWTFVFWGGLHGFYLVINHTWHRIRRALNFPFLFNNITGRVVATAITFGSVVISWVFFRSKTFEGATRILEGMLGMNGAILPSQFVNFFPILKPFVDSEVRVPYLADETIMGFVEMNIMILIGLGIVFFGKNLHDMTHKERLTMLIPTFTFTLQAVALGGAASEFLYFRF